jgi:hypothetical protein
MSLRSNAHEYVPFRNRLNPIAPEYAPLNRRLNENVQRNLNAIPDRLAAEVALNNSLANAKAVEGLNSLNTNLKKTPLKLNINRSVHKNKNVQSKGPKNPWEKLGNKHQQELQRQQELQHQRELQRQRKENKNASNNLFKYLSNVHNSSHGVLMSKWDPYGPKKTRKNRRNRKTRKNRRSRK